MMIVNRKDIFMTGFKSKLGFSFTYKDIEEFETIIDFYEKENARLKEMLIQNGVKQKMLLEDINKYAIGVIDNYLKEN